MASWMATFYTRLHRYKVLLRRRWWIVLITTAIAFCLGAYQVLRMAPVYVSSSRMILTGRVAISMGNLFNEEMGQFFGTQQTLMQSQEVRRRAHERVRMLRPELTRSEPSFAATVIPRANIFQLQAEGPDPEYTQAFLNATMDEYVKYRREMRSQAQDQTATAITEQLLQLDRDLKQSEDDLTEWQKNNSVGYLEGQGNSAAAYLVELNRQLASYETEYSLMERLTLDQSLENQNPSEPAPKGETTKAGDNSNARMSTSGPTGDYMHARQQIELLKGEMQQMEKYLRPKHPKLAMLREQIGQQENLLEIYKRQSMEQIRNSRDALGERIKTTKEQITEWEKKSIFMSTKLAEFERLKAKRDRNKSFYDQLLSNQKSVNVNQQVDTDMIQLLDPATPAYPKKAEAFKIILLSFLGGFVLGTVILIILDRIDDRMNSFVELKENFQERVVGQIPEERSAKEQLLQLNDERHIFAESYRNIRSSLLFMELDHERPKTLLVTSSIPEEGKSTVASNLAITMAFSGARVLLVDADLRRGTVNELFCLSQRPGLGEVLQGQITWPEAVQTTTIDNLYIMTTGSLPRNPGELFLSSVTDNFIRSVYGQFDYIIFDSAPVLATDDTTSFAPKIDGVLFVMRSSFTSSRLSKNALDLLYSRQVNILGLVFNCVNTELPEYYYYQYRDYYHSTGNARREALEATAVTNGENGHHVARTGTPAATEKEGPRYSKSVDPDQSIKS
jgi:capsular exopolysaccharide synthesis family protein